MSYSGIEEAISQLYELINDARPVPLSSDKCMVERERILDMLDEINNELPGELKQARTIVDSRSEVITNAKREAESILKQAQMQAKQLVSQEAVYQEAKLQAEELMRSTHEKIRELKQVTNDFVDDALKNTETAIADALADIRQSRAKFRNLTNPQARANSPIIEDV